MIKSRPYRSLLAAALGAILFMASCGRSNDAASAEVGKEESTSAVQAASTPPAESSTPAPGALDGKRFVVTMGEKGKEEMERDTLHFIAGTFRSNACDQYGFDSAAYTATSRRDTTSFKTVTMSAKEGRMEWSGWSAGGAIGGSVVWIKEGQNPIEYWFKGSVVVQ